MGKWVPLPAVIVADEGEETGHDVKLPTEVLRCDAAAVLDQDGCQVARHEQMKRVVLLGGVQFGRLEEPPNCRHIVANREDTSLGVGVFKALQPHIDNHPDKFKQVVNPGMAADWAGVRDPYSPRTARYAVPTYPKWAGVRPANSVGFSGSDEIDRGSKVGRFQQDSPDG